jgi:hypothetical protein
MSDGVDRDSQHRNTRSFASEEVTVPYGAVVDLAIPFAGTIDGEGALLDDSHRHIDSYVLIWVVETLEIGKWG